MSQTEDEANRTLPEAPEEDLRAQLAIAEAKAAENWEKFLRASAELENVRRRAERDATTVHKYGQERLLGELLLIADSLELGLKAAEGSGVTVEALVEGLKLTQRQLAALFEKNGVRPEDPLRQPFNPERHEAVSMLESAEVPPQHVLTVMQKGYLLHDRVLRPAMVVVARARERAEGENPAPAAGSDGQEGENLNGDRPPPDSRQG